MSDLDLSKKLDLFKRYKLKELCLLGIGGTSEVLLVEDEHGKRFALKRLLGQYRSLREWRDSILIEGVHLTMIQSNRVIRCDEVLTVPLPQAFIKVSIESDPSGSGLGARQEIALLTEYVEGVHLRALLKRIQKDQAPLDEDEIASLIWDISRGLEALHTASRGRGSICPITHGDLSPTNIMIKRDGSAILIDLSSSKSELSKESILRRPGKLSYLSPGAINGEEEGIETDLYALGCIWFELITGRVPKFNQSQVRPPSWTQLQQAGWPLMWAKLVSSLLSPFPQVRSQVNELLNRTSIWGKDKKSHQQKLRKARLSLAKRVAALEALRR